MCIISLYIIILKFVQSPRPDVNHLNDFQETNNVCVSEATVPTCPTK